jgi:hypothetical protein
MGVLLSESQFVDNGTYKRGEFDLSQMPGGMYIVKVNKGGSLVQRKIIKSQ